VIVYVASKSTLADAVAAIVASDAGERVRGRATA